jgi:MFS transporter, DHA1 family, tetracycline resistance protein
LKIIENENLKNHREAFSLFGFRSGHFLKEMGMEPKKGKKKLTLASIFFTFFVDNLCWSIVFPIFAPYFLDPENHLFSSETSLGTRTTILGIFLMSFPLAQFFGSPLIGEFADRSGRKKALIITVFFTLIGLALSAWSLSKTNLILLFISRLITGAFAGNLSICLAAISDLSESEQHKVKHFGFLAVIAGFSFIIGAYFGGKLSDSAVSEYFDPAFPLWIATGLTALNLLFLIFAFQETSEPDKTVSFDFLEGVHNIKKALQTPRLKSIYAIYFLFVFAWTILFQFTPVHLVSAFSFTNSEIGDVAAFMGVSWAIGSGWISKLLMKRFTGLKILECSLIGFTAGCSLIFVPKSIIGLLILLGICVALAGVAWPLCTGVISNMAPTNMQGKVLGMSQSMQSLAMALSPLIGGLADQIMGGFAFIIGAAASFFAALIYFRLKL